MIDRSDGNTNLENSISDADVDSILDQLASIGKGGEEGKTPETDLSASNSEPEEEVDEFPRRVICTEVRRIHELQRDGTFVWVDREVSIVDFGYSLYEE